MHSFGLQVKVPPFLQTVGW